MFDWGQTRYFPVPMDSAGYLRINLAGREPRGIVQGDAEYDAVCQELEQALLSFRDLDSGERIVDEVLRLDDLAPKDAPYRDRLPDLVVTWRDVPPGRGIRSEEFGGLLWNPPTFPSGRAGNHRDGGWLAATGAGIPSGRSIERCSVLDLVPTVFHWLGTPPDECFQGRAVPVLTAGVR